MAANYKNHAQYSRPKQLFTGIGRYATKTIIISALVGILIWQGVIKSQSYSEISALYDQIESQQQINETLRHENERLVIELDTLQDKKFEILESQARYKLGMIQKGEKYYHLIDE